MRKVGGLGYFMMRAFLDFWASTRTIAACRERWQPLRQAVRPRASSGCSAAHLIVDE